MVAGVLSAVSPPSELAGTGWLAGPGWSLADPNSQTGVRQPSCGEVLTVLCTAGTLLNMFSFRLGFP